MVVGQGLDKVRGKREVVSRFHSKASTPFNFIYNPLWCRPGSKVYLFRRYTDSEGILIPSGAQLVEGQFNQKRSNAVNHFDLKFILNYSTYRKLPVSSVVVTI